MSSFAAWTSPVCCFLLKARARDRRELNFFGSLILAMRSSEVSSGMGLGLRSGTHLQGTPLSVGTNNGGRGELRQMAWSALHGAVAIASRFAGRKCRIGYLLGAIGEWRAC